MPAISNDESICANSTSSEAVRLHDSDVDDDGDEVFISREEQDRRLEAAMRKLGNMSRKPLSKYATTDLFIRGRLMLGGIAKTRKLFHAKRKCQRELIYKSVEYFGTQMAKRRLRLEECLVRSSDNMYGYHMPHWKRAFKNHIKQTLG